MTLTQPGALIVTLGGLLIHGPAIVTLESATTIAQGFRSSDQLVQWGVPQIWVTDIHSAQEFGYWNGLTVEVPTGAELLITPARIPASLHWRMAVGGAWSTPATGINGFKAADQNLDGFIDGLDSDLWKNWFETGDDRADFNADGFIDGLDSDTFNNEWDLR